MVVSEEELNPDYQKDYCEKFIYGKKNGAELASKMIYNSVNLTQIVLEGDYSLIIGENKEEENNGKK